jgi:enamine deaminase RidA (YjgF/YER057c/UK114 family)
MSAEKRLKELKIDLGPVSAPVANYVNAVRTGNLLYLAGKGPRPDASGKRPQGKVGREYKVKRVVKVLGMVNAMPEFADHPQVINGCSDLFVEVLGERGKHARSAVGMGSLPMQIPVEIEVIVEVD